MQYRFFICKPSHERHVSKSLRKFCLHEYSFVEQPTYLKSFDVKSIEERLLVASGETAGESPIFKFKQFGGDRMRDLLPLIMVLTEYSLASKVLEALSKCIAEEDGLVIFDAEMRCLNAISEIHKYEREELVRLRLAQLRYRKMLRQRLNTTNREVLVSIYTLGDCLNMGDDYIRSPVIDTSIALMRGDLRSVAKQLYAILSECAEEHGECVYCKDGCFIVKNKVERYRLRFVLEGTGKSPMNLCWIENGEVKLELLHRMGVFRTRKAIKELEGWSKACEEEDYIRSRLYFSEDFFTRGEWQNPADRFVDSYKISCRLKKNKMDLIYGSHVSKSHNEFGFCEFKPEYNGYGHLNTESGFSITEEEAAPLLALVEDVIPYYHNYYYDTFNVRKEEAEQILARLKEMRAIVAKKSIDENLDKMSDLLLNYSFKWPSLPDEDAIMDRTERKKRILYSHCRELVALYDFFEWWLNGLHMFEGFYIIGP